MSPGNEEFTSEFFDYSSKAWMKNKLRNGAQLVYRCDYEYSANRRCTMPVIVKKGSPTERCLKHKQRVQK